MEDEPTLMDMFKGLARLWKLIVAVTLVPTIVVARRPRSREHVHIEARNLDSPGVGSRDVPDTGNPRTCVCRIVLVLDRDHQRRVRQRHDSGEDRCRGPGRDQRASVQGECGGTFSASFPLAGTATIAVVGKSRPGFSMLLNLPAIPSVARHVLPVMTFSYDGTSGTLGLAGKLIRKPAGAVKGYVTDAETRGSISFAVGKDDRLSTTLRLGTGLNTLHSYVRYLLLMRYTLPDFTVTVGPVPRTIISLQVGSPRMTVDGVVKAIDAQGTKPLISNGTTMVPIRTIVESLGGSVGWDTAARRLDIRLGSRTVTTWVSKTTATVNGSSTTMRVTPAIIGGRTMIPLRFVAENLGCLVGWDQPTRGVTVIYDG